MRLAVRLTLAESGPSPHRLARPHTETKWKGVESLEHGELCRVFGLDPVTHRWDLPRSAHVGQGAAYSGRGARVSGYLERHDGKGWTPVGSIHVVREGERFRDLDPVDPRDQFDLNQTR